MRRYETGEARPLRRLRILAVLLSTLLVGSVVISVALWIALQRTRGELTAAEEVKPAAPAPPPPPPREIAPAKPPVQAAPEDRLLILLTVGTRHYAEKQLRTLRQHCRASLAVYLQRRGRCGWSQCFAVAAREADADLARSCGPTKGQALRDRTDFALIQ